MAKNKQKKKQNNSQEDKIKDTVNVNVEIDYDKLATAIVSAQEKSKNNFEESFTNGTFAVLTGWLLHIIGVAGFIISFYALGYGIYHAITVLQWIDGGHIFANIIACIILLILIFSIGLLSFMLFVSGNEIEKSKDKNFVVAVFSALSGFIALVVALVALFK